MNKLLSTNGISTVNIYYSKAYTTKAALKIDPGKTIVALANSLSQKLNSITGATFQVLPLDINASTDNGIVLGLGKDFTHSSWIFGGDYFPNNDPVAIEHYAIRTHEGGVFLAGATVFGVQHAVWDFLYHIGYRQYFPSPTWEIIPSITELNVDLDVLEKPDFLDRYYWGGHGQWSDQGDRVNDWKSKNRMTRGFSVLAGNGGYESIISRNKSALEENSNYFALVNGVRITNGTKFCSANPGLRQIVVNDVLKRFENPLVTSQSLEASDVPTGYCECNETIHNEIVYPGCNQLFGSLSEGRHTITNRIVSLANLAASAVREIYPSRKFFIGMLAYSTHSEPPTIEIDPNVSIGFSSDYNGGRNTPNLMLQWMKEWEAKGSVAGALRDYWSNADQHWDMPGASAMCYSNFLARTAVPYYHSGLKFMSAEANYNWGPCGLGYWLASRILWNVDDIHNIENIKNDFFIKCFGVTNPDCVISIKKFYDVIDGVNAPKLSTQLIGNMYQHLRDALVATESNDVKVRNRIYDLILYTRWVELRRNNIDSKNLTEEVDLTFERLMRWAYRIRWTEMVHGHAMWRGFGDRIPIETEGKAPWKDPLHSWKSDSALGINGYQAEEILEIAGATGTGSSDQDLGSILFDGVINNPLTVSWIPKSFPPIDLIPVPSQMLSNHKFYNVWGYYSYITSEHSFYVWIDSPGEFTISYLGGISAPRPHVLGIVNLVDNETNITISSDQAYNDGLTHELVLTANRPGLHRIDVKPGHKIRAKLDWPKGLKVTLNYGNDKSQGEYRYIYRCTQYFYVPKGTEVIGMWYDTGGNKLEAITGPQYTFTSAAGNYATIPVPEGLDGTFWRFTNNPGTRLLMTVPSYFARHPSELLLPRSVIEKDFTNI